MTEQENNYSEYVFYHKKDGYICIFELPSGEELEFMKYKILKQYEFLGEVNE